MAQAKPRGNYWYGYDPYTGNLGPTDQLTKDEATTIANERAKRLRPQLPKGRFDIIYADPPWRYDFSKSNSRAIESHYESMSIDDICALDIPSITKQDCLLYLWATSPKLLEAIRVIEAWGFKYVTNYVWVKNKMGMGYHAIGKHELLLLATKGKMRPPGAQMRYQSVINASRGEHSKKPEQVYSIIEEAYPPTEFKIIELFARNKRPQWEAWGNEC